LFQTETVEPNAANILCHYFFRRFLAIFCYCL